MTVRQERILRFICQTIESQGRQPCIREIGKKFSISSPNGVASHLRALERKGYIKRRRGLTGLVIRNWKQFV